MASDRNKTASRNVRRTSGTRAASKGAARRPASRATEHGPPSLTLAHAKGFLAGTVAGVLLGVGGVTYLTKETAIADMSGQAATETAVDQRAKPRFDFYTLLPNQNLDFSSDVEPAELDPKHSNDDLFILQAGSFRAERDADRRRGELALLGLEATIEQIRNDNGVWYRVYLGPFESRSVMAKARSMTAQQSIDTLLLKRSRNP